MKDWLYKEKKIVKTKNKYFCLQIGRDKNSNSIFEFLLAITRRRDHAGFEFSLNLRKFYFYFQIYDNRHWCNKCNDWKNEICYEENHSPEA